MLTEYFVPANSIPIKYHCRKKSKSLNNYLDVPQIKHCWRVTTHTQSFGAGSTFSQNSSAQDLPTHVNPGYHCFAICHYACKLFKGFCISVFYLWSTLQWLGGSPYSNKQKLTFLAVSIEKSAFQVQCTTKNPWDLFSLRLYCFA